MRHLAPAIPLAFLLCLNPAKLAAAVVVVGNMTPQPVRVTLSHPGQPPTTIELAIAEVRPFPCGRHTELTYTIAGKTIKYQLDAYGAYLFLAENGTTALQGIELLGTPVPLDDVPLGPPATADPYTVTVKLMMDDADRRTPRAWHPVVRQRFNRAAAIVTAHCPVRFEIVDLKSWASNPDALDMSIQFSDFEDTVRPNPARLVVGFTSRNLGSQPGAGPFAATRAVLHPYILMREREPRNESERVEVLVQQLGKYLGAVHSPDPLSAMRTKLGDGKAAHAKFRVGFDPLNTLAMNIWVEELRDGRGPKWTDLRPEAQLRLGRIYATLRDALPDEPQPEEYAGLVARALGRPGAAPAEPRVAVAPPAAAVEQLRPFPLDRPGFKLTPKQEAVRKVVRAIVLRAEQNARRRDNRLVGDELTASYVTAAADVARFEDRPLQATAFLIGLGIALDDSAILRKNPLTADFCKAVESDEERDARLAVLGLPTVRDRRDLCQHFVVSCALTELIGPALAEQAGLAKELLDMKGTSGFSFSDMCANIAGIEFAKLVQRKPDLLEEWWREFKVNDVVPAMNGLRDGLAEDQFKRYYGSISDERFKLALDEIRKRVLSLWIHERHQR
jgi:hypothetical protein